MVKTLWEQSLVLRFKRMLCLVVCYGQSASWKALWNINEQKSKLITEGDKDKITCEWRQKGKHPKIQCNI